MQSGGLLCVENKAAGPKGLSGFERCKLRSAPNYATFESLQSASLTASLGPKGSQRRFRASAAPEGRFVGADDSVRPQNAVVFTEIYGKFATFPGPTESSAPTGYCADMQLPIGRAEGDAGIVRAAGCRRRFRRTAPARMCGAGYSSGRKRQAGFRPPA